MPPPPPTVIEQLAEIADLLGLTSGCNGAAGTCLVPDGDGGTTTVEALLWDTYAPFMDCMVSYSQWLNQMGDAASPPLGQQMPADFPPFEIQGPSYCESLLD